MIQKKVTDFFALEGNYPDLDGEGAAARLSAAIRCKTINYFDHSRTDYTEFDKLHAHIKASYPNIMRVGTFERIGHHAVLITIPGSNASLRPCLYMSHQDVVFIPSMTAGATDAHRYEEICDTCLRCSPFMTEPAEAASGVHGTNERLLVRSYLQGIRVLIDLMEHANVEP